MPRPRKLSDAKAAELREMYALGLSLAPKKLCVRFDITRDTMRAYLTAGHQRKRYTTDELLRELGYE